MYILEEKVGLWGDWKSFTLYFTWRNIRLGGGRTQVDSISFSSSPCVWWQLSFESSIMLCIVCMQDEYAQVDKTSCWLGLHITRKLPKLVLPSVLRGRKSAERRWWLWPPPFYAKMAFGQRSGKVRNHHDPGSSSVLAVGRWSKKIFLTAHAGLLLLNCGS